MLGTGERVFTAPLTIESVSTTVFSGGAAAHVFAAHPLVSLAGPFDLESSLRRVADADWIGNAEPATFSPYKRDCRC